MRYAQICLSSILISALLPISAKSYFFLSSKFDWDGLSRDGKSGYIMSIHDGWLFEIGFGSHNEGDTNSLAFKRVSCIVTRALNTDNLIEILDSGYAENKTWGDPPRIVFERGIDRFCKIK